MHPYSPVAVFLECLTRVISNETEGGRVTQGLSLTLPGMDSQLGFRAYATATVASATRAERCILFLESIKEMIRSRDVYVYITVKLTKNLRLSRWLTLRVLQKSSEIALMRYILYED